MLGRHGGGNMEAAGHTVSTVRKQRQTLAPSPLSVYLVQVPNHGTLLTSFRVGLIEQCVAGLRNITPWAPPRLTPMRAESQAEELA